MILNIINFNGFASMQRKYQRIIKYGKNITLKNIVRKKEVFMEWLNIIFMLLICFFDIFLFTTCIPNIDNL